MQNNHFLLRVVKHTEEIYAFACVHVHPTAVARRDAERRRDFYFLRSCVLYYNMVRFTIQRRIKLAAQEIYYIFVLCIRRRCYNNIIVL